MNYKIPLNTEYRLYGFARQLRGRGHFGIATRYIKRDANAPAVRLGSAPTGDVFQTLAAADAWSLKMNAAEGARIAVLS